MREKLRQFIESSRFEWTITAVIVANAIVLGLETVPSIMRDYGGVLKALDTVTIPLKSYDLHCM